MDSTANDINQLFPVNCRIRVTDAASSSYVGTVRYVGPVQNYKGDWLGIEWDEECRGKHDGTIDGITYFKTSSPTSASMIRPGKVCPFESLFTAIEEKYILSSAEDDKVAIAEAKKKFHAPLLELVGMQSIKEKQSHWGELKNVVVVYSNVNSAGNLQMLSNLTELELTSSLIYNWKTVADITKQLVSLIHLNLSKNRLELPSSADINELEPHFRHLKLINLRECNLKSWDDLLYIAQLWPNVEKLAFKGNYLNTFSHPDTSKVFKNLRELDLQENNINDFNEILKLGNITTLSYLNLLSNGIQSIELPDCEPDERLDIFQGLEILEIKDNPIVDECNAFNELDKLKAFNNLSYKPQNKENFENFQSNAVGRIKNLKVLNKIGVTDVCRRGAEYDLWKSSFGLAWLNATTDEERKGIAKKCRAYPRIVAKYGLPADLQPVKKVSNLITITIRVVKTNEEMVKKVPKNMSIRALQGIVMKKFGSAGTTIPSLSYVDKDHDEIIVKMENLTKPLDYYSIQDGDVVVVDW